MAFTFEFLVKPDFNFLHSFANAVGVPVHRNRVELPAFLGDGYIKKIDLEENIRLVEHHYRLYQDLYLKRIEQEEENDLVSIVFNSQEIPTMLEEARASAIQYLKANGSAIQIASSTLGTDSYFRKGSDVHFAVVGITRKRLSALLKLDRQTPVIETILTGVSPFFFHENMLPDVRRILKQLVEVNDADPLGSMVYAIKVQELMYHLFSQLLMRDSEKQVSISKTDLDKMYEVRNEILSDLSKQPGLKQLAKKVGCSETKMKNLFKQVFGDSIYRYYQKARMEEAAFLLKQARHSVSDVGYGLGFVNLSHFSRLFEQHYGITPKKYANSITK